MCNLIDKILLNIEEYKKSNYIHKEYILWDKVYRYKAIGDITFGNKTTISTELDNLKKKLNEEVDNKELKEELN